MATTLQQLRQPRCLADSNQSYQRVEVSACWQLHVGTIRLFIIGPGEDAWFPASEPCYTGRIGTEEERAIARRAVRLLDRLRRYDYLAGAAEIKAALRQAASEIRRGIPEIIAPPEPEVLPSIHPRPNKTAAPLPPDQSLIRRALFAVATITGVKESAIYATSKTGADRKLNHARCMFQGIVSDLHPRTYHSDLAAAMGRCRSALSHAVINHKARLLDFPAYAATYQKIQSLCTPTAHSTTHP